jgi:hypothetical protein
VSGRTPTRIDLIITERQEGAEPPNRASDNGRAIGRIDTAAR